MRRSLAAVVVPAQVQEAVRDQAQEFGARRVAIALRLGGEARGGEVELAREPARHTAGPVVGVGEREDVGGAVDAAVLRVEAAQLGVGGEDDAHLGPRHALARQHRARVGGEADACGGGPAAPAAARSASRGRPGSSG
jgi:hypothetical protein